MSSELQLDDLTFAWRCTFIDFAVDEAVASLGEGVALEEHVVDEEEVFEAVVVDEEDDAELSDDPIDDCVVGSDVCGSGGVACLFVLLSNELAY